MTYLKITVIFLLMAMTVNNSVKAQTVFYEADQTVFFNPERGFYRHTETRSNSYSLLNETVLNNYKKDNVSLILRVFYLERFVNDSISEAYLQNMDKDFDMIRKVGLKVIVRFAYTTRSTPPYGDAMPQRVLQHIQQLKPLLQKHAAVIALMQTGFVGAWGEWYYTDHFSAALGSPNQNDWKNRTDLVNALLDALPPSRMIQVRTPLIKRSLVGVEASLPVENAFSGQTAARIGHHNDCFLASSSDFGTYIKLEDEKKYLEEETRFLVMGGETCNVSRPRSECPTALEELERFHWSYLNKGYHPDVLSDWNRSGCYTDVEKKLGYRFRLISTTLPDKIGISDMLPIQIKLVNDGWANPYNERKIYFGLKSKTSGKETLFDLESDCRKWPIKDTITISKSLSLNGLDLDEYETFLFMPDLDETLSLRPEYAIRFSNLNVWEPATGKNQLTKNVTVVLSTNTEQQSALDAVNVYPIPSTNDLRIFNGTPKDLQYSVFTSDGKLVHNGKVTSNQTTSIDENKIKLPGVYMILLSNGTEQKMIRSVKI